MTSPGTENVVDKYSRADAKMFMTIAEAEALARELAGRLQEPPRPIDLVVGIPNGALLISKIVSEELGLPLHILRIQRKGSIVKQRLAKVPGVVRMAALWYSLPVVNYPLRWVMHRFEKLKCSSPINDLPVPSARAVVIDDAVESGQTLKAAKELLLQAGCQHVMTAVLAWSKAHENEPGHEVPDIFIGRRIQHFPWSGNSPFVKEHEEWLAVHGLELRK